jgi:Mg2+/Co2+ transporter CorB
MTLGQGLIIGAIIVLLVFSAFFSGSETAITAASRARMHSLAKRGSWRAALVNRLIGKRERLIGALLLGNNMVTITASTLAAGLFLELFGHAGVAYATLVMTVLVVIFAEVLPKTYAINKPDRMSLAVAPSVNVVVNALAPLASAVQAVVRLLLRAMGAGAPEAAQEMAAHDELRGAIDLHHREGAVVKLTRDMLGGILDLRELTVSDIMVHRTKMETLDADSPPETIIEEALKSPYTRFPIWKDEPENIIGVLHSKNLLRAVREAQGDLSKINVVEIASEPWFVPDATSLKDQLSAFLKKKAHVALVVDEYGEVMGLVTLEDILEEIVGEISDELDVVISGIRPQPDGSVLVEGSVPIRDLNRFMDWSLPDEEATTIAGLVIHEAQIIPERGQAFTFYGFRFEVLRRQRNKITQLMITQVKPGAGAAARR